jgi:endonuclease-3
VLRVSNRIGIASSEDPEAVEQQLTAALPAAEWTLASDTLILHGRRVCKPRPVCDRCAVSVDCDSRSGLVSAAPPAGRAAGSGPTSPSPARSRAAASRRRR